MPLIIKEQGSHHTEFRTEDDTVRIDVKWDGCVNIWKHSNGSTVTEPLEGEIGYIHICDLAEFIEQLKQVYNHALNERGFEMD